MIAARTSDVSSRIELMAGDAEAAEAKLRADFEALTAMDERLRRPNIAALLAKALFELGRPRRSRAEFAAVAAEIASHDDVEAQAILRAVQARILSPAGAMPDARDSRDEVLELVARDRRARPARRLPPRHRRGVRELTGASASPRSRKRARSTSRSGISSGSTRVEAALVERVRASRRPL